MKFPKPKTIQVDELSYFTYYDKKEVNSFLRQVKKKMKGITERAKQFQANIIDHSSALRGRANLAQEVLEWLKE